MLFRSGRLPVTVSASSGTTLATFPLPFLMRVVPTASVKTDATIKRVRDVTEQFETTYTTLSLGLSSINVLDINANVYLASANQMLVFNLVVSLSAEL